MKSTEIIDLATKTSRMVGEMIEDRIYFAMATLGNKIYAFGNYAGSAMTTIESFDDASETWTKEEHKLEEMRGYFGLVTLPKDWICPGL